MTKIEKIKRFLDKYKHLPEQRTVEWYKNRVGRFGGSEIYNIINLKKTNINSFVNNFLYYKIVNKGQQFIFPCIFGNIFENEIKNLTEYNFKTEIFEMGSVPYAKLKNIAYSPDGIGIVDNEIILFEFKCPISREIKSEVKYEYFCQVHTGLHVLEEVLEGRAFYIEAEFKKCKLDDLINKDKFDNIFHNKFLDRNFEELYKHFGMILFYENDTINNNTMTYDYIDYGEATQSEMEVLFFNVFKKNFKQIYLSDVVNGLIKAGNTNDILLKYKELNNNFTIEEINYLKNLLLETCKDKKGIPVGILPWKSFNYNKIEMQKNPHFICNEVKEKCIYFAHIIQYVTKLKENKNLNSDEIKDLLKKYTELFFKYR